MAMNPGTAMLPVPDENKRYRPDEIRAAQFLNPQQLARVQERASRLDVSSSAAISAWGKASSDRITESIPEITKAIHTQQLGEVGVLLDNFVTSLRTDVNLGSFQNYRRRSWHSWRIFRWWLDQYYKLYLQYESAGEKLKAIAVRQAQEGLSIDNDIALLRRVTANNEANLIGMLVDIAVAQDKFQELEREREQLEDEMAGGATLEQTSRSEDLDQRKLLLQQHTLNLAAQAVVCLHFRPYLKQTLNAKEMYKQSIQDGISFVNNVWGTAIAQAFLTYNLKLARQFEEHFRQNLAALLDLTFTSTADEIVKAVELTSKGIVDIEQLKRIHQEAEQMQARVEAARRTASGALAKSTVEALKLNADFIATQQALAAEKARPAA